MTLTSPAGATGDTPKLPRWGDNWHAAFLAARQLQEDEGWDDFLLPTQKALDAIEALTLDGKCPFMVVNGLTSSEFVWLWLSPDAIMYLKTNQVHVLAGCSKVESHLYMTINEVPRGAQGKVQLLEWDCKTTADMARAFLATSARHNADILALP